MAGDQLSEVLAWKLWGAVAWHFILYISCCSLWYLASTPGSGHLGQPFRFTTWLRLFGNYLTALLVLYTQRRLLSSTDVPPLYVAHLGLTGKSWMSLFFTRCLKRNGKLVDLLDVAAFYGSCALCGTWSIRSLLRQSGSTSKSWQGTKIPLVYGTTLGLLYAVIYLIRAKNTLNYPIIHRHRYYRIKKRLRSVARSVLLLSSSTLLLSLALGPLVLHMPSPSYHPKAWLMAWRAGLLVAATWALGAHVLEVVFTEPVKMAEEQPAAGGGGEGANPTASLITALQHKDPLVQDWALQDLAAVAAGAAGAAGRRAAIWADETGQCGWTPLTRYCLVEVNDFIAVLAAAQPAAAAGPGAGGGSGGVKWNVLQLSASGAKAATREQDVAAWQLRSRYYRLVWSVGALSDLAAASLAEDVYGVAQLSAPHLADVLLSLLGLVSVLQAYNKTVSSTPNRPATPLTRRLQQLLGMASGSLGGGDGAQGGLQHVDVAAYALLDTAKRAVYKATQTFGPVLGSMLRQSSCKVPVGTKEEALALLDSFLQQEQ